ncbi:MAG TPA: hypothetical protein PKD53_30975 [Chloroflexaceae bacterium]|nr:hypothetical protein [Chloroflexaceae bacterium]
MAQVVNIPTAVIEQFRTALRALRDLPGYRPVNPAYSLDTLEVHETALAAAEREEERLERLLDEARAHRRACARTFRDAMRGAYLQVLAQFGEDSRIVKAFGLIPKSERKRPTKRVAAAD